jgi:hypothetical protein
MLQVGQQQHNACSFITLQRNWQQVCPNAGLHQNFLTLYSPVFTLFTISFNIQQFYVLPTQCIYVFYMDLGTNSNYFPL